MSLMWNRCVRCGVELSEWEETDLPTCEACAGALREPKPGDEPTRACPVDGSPMTKEVVHMVAIDRCPSCHGVWLDGGELDLINRAVASGSGRVFASHLVLGIAL